MARDKDRDVEIMETVEAEVTRKPMRIVKEEKKETPKTPTQIRQERNKAPKCGRCGRVIIIEGEKMESYRVTPTAVYHEDMNCHRK